MRVPIGRSPERRWAYGASGDFGISASTGDLKEEGTLKDWAAASSDGLSNRVLAVKSYRHRNANARKVRRCAVVFPVVPDGRADRL